MHSHTLGKINGALFYAAIVIFAVICDISWAKGVNNVKSRIKSCVISLPIEPNTLLRYMTVAKNIVVINYRHIVPFPVSFGPRQYIGSYRASCCNYSLSSRYHPSVESHRFDIERFSNVVIGQTACKIASCVSRWGEASIFPLEHNIPVPRIHVTYSCNITRWHSGNVSSKLLSSSISGCFVSSFGDSDSIICTFFCCVTSFNCCRICRSRVVGQAGSLANGSFSLLGRSAHFGELPLHRAPLEHRGTKLQGSCHKEQTSEYCYNPRPFYKLSVEIIVGLIFIILSIYSSGIGFWWLIFWSDRSRYWGFYGVVGLATSAVFAFGFVWVIAVVIYSGS